MKCPNDLNYCKEQECGYWDEVADKCSEPARNDAIREQTQAIRELGSKLDLLMNK